MRARYLIANWKMNLPPEGVEAWLGAASGADGSARVMVAPPFPFIAQAAAGGSGLAVAGQNCSDHASGSFTGEVSPAMLLASGAMAVIIGHSERRNLFHESDALVGRKLALAIENGLTPVLCIGEDLRTRDAGHVARFLAEQIKATAVPALEAARTVVIAYEPIWAIGTGRNADGAMVAETLDEIRQAVGRFWPQRYASAVSILYGGSVTPDNVDDLEANGQADGYLVGGASLDSRKFLAILAAMR